MIFYFLKRTIEEDPEYKLFIEQLQKGPEYLPSAEQQYEERKKKEEADKPKTTPILEELKAKSLQTKQKQPRQPQNRRCAFDLRNFL